MCNVACREKHPQGGGVNLEHTVISKRAEAPSALASVAADRVVFVVSSCSLGLWGWGGLCASCICVARLCVHGMRCMGRWVEVLGRGVKGRCGPEVMHSNGTKWTATGLCWLARTLVCLGNMGIRFFCAARTHGVMTRGPTTMFGKVFLAPVKLRILGGDIICRAFLLECPETVSCSRRR